MIDADQIAKADRHVPALARVYDYVLGGGQNFAADRELAEKILAIVPGYRTFAITNRAFLRRAVLHLLADGITQFLDLGSGLITVGPVHEVAHAIESDARVVYVDHDPVAVEHSKLLTDNERVGVIQGDLRNVDAVLGHQVTTSTLDLARPVGLLAVAVLHCIPDGDDPAGILATYHSRLAAGSRLAASHPSGDSLSVSTTSAVVRSFADAGIRVVSRTRQQFAALLGPWKTEPDGVVHTNWWRPEGQCDQPGDVSLGYAVLATSTRHKTNNI